VYSHVGFIPLQIPKYISRWSCTIISIQTLLHFGFILGESLTSSTITPHTCVSLFPAAGF
jgi:hypothetical protein